MSARRATQPGVPGAHCSQTPWGGSAPFEAVGHAAMTSTAASVSATALGPTTHALAMASNTAAIMHHVVLITQLVLRIQSGKWGKFASRAPTLSAGCQP